MRFNATKLALALALSACGAQSEGATESHADNEQLIDDEGAVVDEPEEIELGQSAEALTVPFRYGIFDTHDNGNTPCAFPNTTGPTCFLPSDRQIRIRWTGPTTDSRFPGIDFRQQFRNALSSWNTDLSLNGIPWSIQEVSSGPETVQLSSLGGCTLGATNWATVGARQCLTKGVTGPTPQCVSKVNSCQISVSPANMAACGYVSGNTQFDSFEIQTVIKHELGHCFGLPHAAFTNCGDPGSFMNAGLCGVNHTFPTANLLPNGDEVSALQSYTP